MTVDRSKGPCNAYVDGLNLYYGSLDQTNLKWLDLYSLSSELISETPSVVRYFSARVKSLPWNPHGHQRQDVYWRALRISGVDIVEGQFLVEDKWKRLANPMVGFRASPKRVYVTVPEEKGSDVNLGATLLVDAYESDLRHALVITNDSDLVFPINQALRLGVDVTIANPHPQPAKALRGIDVDGRKPTMVPIFPQALKRCQFPPEIVDPATGKKVRRPKSWA